MARIDFILETAAEAHPDKWIFHRGAPKPTEAEVKAAWVAAVGNEATIDSVKGLRENIARAAAARRGRITGTLDGAKHRLTRGGKDIIGGSQ